MSTEHGLKENREIGSFKKSMMARSSLVSEVKKIVCLMSSDIKLHQLLHCELSIACSAVLCSL